MVETVDRDVIVAGAGPVGMVAAIALDRAGFSVVLAGPPSRPDDRRTTALMLPAMRYLAELEIAALPADRVAPLSAMRIVDATSRLLRSRPVTFRAEEIGERAFGTNIPNLVLNAALQATIEARPSIEWHREAVAAWTPEADRVTCALADGTVLGARLAVAADGRESPARQAAGITTRRKEYPQTAIVLNFGHARGHGNVSTEFHTETGPCTQVPLPGNRSSLVWVVSPEQAGALMELDDETLSVRVEERLQSLLGRVSVEPGRQAWPLSALVPSSLAARRFALVGEAAHVFPPIGAQGLNLGLRDVSDMARVAAEHRSDPGGEPALRAYRAARRADIVARTGAVNLLNMALLSDALPAQLARSAGIGLLAGIAPLRGFFMREGMQPGSGLTRIFSSRGKEIRRQHA